VRRRDVLSFLGVAACSYPFASGAQQPERIRQIGVLMGLPQSDVGAQAEIATFQRRLSALGWVEGRNIHLEIRWAGGDIALARTFASELTAANPDVLLSRSTPTTAALKRETSTIPIVFVNVAEPVESGFVQSLAHPGGNITGFTNFEGSIGGKWLQLLQEFDPRVRRVAVIYNPVTAPFAGAFLRSIQMAAPTLAIEAVNMPVQSEGEITAALMMFSRDPGAALIAIPDSFTFEHRKTIIAVCAQTRLPALYTNLLATPDGGLMAYAVDTRTLFHRAAAYVDRILKGAKPGDLPVELPTQFELSINLKTAKALELEIPATLIARADEVIE
jgi:putative tryptophan/tyrosine transport system substrate-binding protein